MTQKKRKMQHFPFTHSQIKPLSKKIKFIHIQIMEEKTFLQSCGEVQTTSQTAENNLIN